jgi:hypothetical protein
VSSALVPSVLLSSVLLSSVLVSSARPASAAGGAPPPVSGLAGLPGGGFEALGGRETMMVASSDSGPSATGGDADSRSHQFITSGAALSFAEEPPGSRLPSPMRIRVEGDLDTGTDKWPRKAQVVRPNIHISD